MPRVRLVVGDAHARRLQAAAAASRYSQARARPKSLGAKKKTGSAGKTLRQQLVLINEVPAAAGEQVLAVLPSSIRLLNSTSWSKTKKAVRYWLPYTAVLIAYRKPSALPC
jgi:hypothetical protein